MEISFIRHGKSTCVENETVTYTEFKEWVNKYDSCGVFEENSYPIESLNKITMVGVVFTSDLTRSIQSAKILNPNSNVISNPLFREVELPFSKINFCNVKLKPSGWIVIFRLLWFMGYSRGCESLKHAKYRAVKAVELLTTTAKENSNLVIVGHGFFNRMLAKELQKIGWEGSKKTSSKHWKCTTYFL